MTDIRALLKSRIAAKKVTHHPEPELPSPVPDAGADAPAVQQVPEKEASPEEAGRCAAASLTAPPVAVSAARVQQIREALRLKLEARERGKGGPENQIPSSREEARERREQSADSTTSVPARARKPSVEPPDDGGTMLLAAWKCFLQPLAERVLSESAADMAWPYFIFENPYPAETSHVKNAWVDLLASNNGVVIPADVLGPVSVSDLPNRKDLRMASCVVIVTSLPNRLPDGLLEMIAPERYLRLPALDADRLRNYLLGSDDLSVEDGQALQRISPRLTPRMLALAAGRPRSHCVKALTQLVTRHMKPDAGNSCRLDDLFGIDMVKHWAKHLISDLKLAAAGKIEWREVDRGALLVGAPGTGKTTVARAIAAEAGVYFKAVSPPVDWMTGNGLDESIGKMAATFAAARQQAPAILFIDEIDSIGSRENFQGNNASWSTAFLDALLTEIDGFESNRQLVVIGATNYQDNVDPALRRAGRLDREIRLPLPSAQALRGKLKAELDRYEHDLAAGQLDECANSAIGLTGADIEVLVRGARRRARTDGQRPIHVTDVMDEIFRIPPEAERHPLIGDELVRVALHEAGHAVVGLSLPSLADQVRVASVIPNGEGAQGFVGIGPSGSAQTRAGIRDRLCMILGGACCRNDAVRPRRCEHRRRRHVARQ